MAYHVRLMRKEDITQVTEIDREAFPTQLPAPNFNRELQNRLAHYLVVWDDEKTMGTPEEATTAEQNSTGLASRWKRLFNLNNIFNNEAPPPMSGQRVSGFVGFWVMADEAHIISIAIREIYRRRGIGELLLISSINMAIELKAHTMTLEVRVSNTDAQHLYTKYGFTQTGIRHGYYIDNKEDGMVMTTQGITSAEFQTSFHQLKQSHSQKWGMTLNQISR